MLALGTHNLNLAASAASAMGNAPMWRSRLPPELRAHSASSVDEVQAAQRTFHRARLINLTQDEAVDGCRRLSQRKIYCSAMQGGAWTSPATR